MGKLKDALRTVWAFRQTLILVLTPLLLLWIPLQYPGKEARCAYAIGIMAVYWCTEALPIAATSLLPVILFPLLGVIGSRELCANYFKDVTLLCFSGLLVAVAVEKWNLHKRIALKMVCLLGSKPHRLFLGFMCTSCFLSMWISNTATAAMLMPIAHAVMTEINDNRKRRRDMTLLSKHVILPDQTSHDQTGTNKEAAVKDTEIGAALANMTSPVCDSDVTLLPRHDVDDVKQTALMPHGLKMNADFLGRDLYANGNRESPKVTSSEDRRFHQLGVGLRISIAFAANIGGTGTLTGTASNLVLKGQIDQFYGQTPLNFSSWMVFAVPNMILCLFAAWAVMTVVFIGPRQMFRCSNKTDRDDEEAANQLIKLEYKKLGEISFAEMLVLIMFTLLALTWMTRDPAFFSGWGKLPFLKPGYVSDASAGMIIACLLFMLPSRKPSFPGFRASDITSRPCPSPALLDWDTVQSKLAWSVVFLLGGSFALADACAKSGLSVALGNIFNIFTSLPVPALVLVLSTITTLVTEITSNVATTTIFLPIVAQLAENMGVHPFYLMFPVALSASMAFMLPVATPTNAIVFAYGNTRIIDMVKSGVVLNILCIIIIQFSLNTYGFALFDVDSYPSWAPVVNVTSVAASNFSSTMFNTTLLNDATWQLLNVTIK